MPDSRKNNSGASRKRSTRSIKMPRVASALPTVNRRTRQEILGGGAMLAAAAATVAAVMMRRRLAKLALDAAAEAVTAGHSMETLGGKIGDAVRREMKNVDFDRLLTYAGLRRRRSVFRRLLAPVGVLAAVAAAAGSALFILAPKLRAAGKEALDSLDEQKGTRPEQQDRANETYAQNANGSMNSEGEASSYAAR